MPKATMSAAFVPEIAKLDSEIHASKPLAKRPFLKPHLTGAA